MKRTGKLPLVAASVLGTLLSISPPARADTVFITGANSGIGLEFVKEYAAKGWTVIATHRRDGLPESLAAVIKDHKNVRVEHLDVADLDEIKSLAAKLKDVPIDVLINNAGVYSDRSVCTDEACRGQGDTQTFTKTDYALFDQIMAVNVRGPLAVSEAFIGNVRASKQKKLIAISSTNGSVSQPLGGDGAMAYRASKAALNREFQLIAVHEKREGVTVLMLHPGAVLTERQANFKAFPGMVEMEPSVQGMINVIEKATLADTGKFIQYDGTTAPW